MSATAAQLLVIDLDGTLLHDGVTFEDRSLSQRSIDTLNAAHDRGVRIVVATARPVSTGLHFIQQLPVDACAYLNGALLDFDPAHSTYDSLTDGSGVEAGTVAKVGFDSQRACEVCKSLTAALPGMKTGIVMDDIRYTNFDVTEYWQTQTWRYSDFTDVPDGTADKLIIFPNEHEWKVLESGTVLPDDFDVHISEGTLWMLTNPHANKGDALRTMADRLGVSVDHAVTFGDDLVDLDMMAVAGHTVAVANAHQDVVAAADEVCASNNDDGVAQWIELNVLQN